MGSKESEQIWIDLTACFIQEEDEISIGKLMSRPPLLYKEKVYAFHTTRFDSSGGMGFKVGNTFPDSFVSMRLGPSYGVPPEPLKSYHENVFLLSELAELVKQHGIPDDETDADYDNYAREPFEKYIEVQVWSDTPVMEYLTKR